MEIIKLVIICIFNFFIGFGAGLGVIAYFKLNKFIKHYDHNIEKANKMNTKLVNDLNINFEICSKEFNKINERLTKLENK